MGQDAAARGLQPGQTILSGRYRVTRPLGEGGMGSVFEAVQLELDRRVAVKTLHPRLVSDERLRARFRSEAKTLARLHHPHIAQVIDYGIEGAQPIIVMEYLDGESLRAVLTREGRLPLETALRITGPVLRALAAAHELSIVHRDVKPENVLVLWDDGLPIPKLIDFGIAKRADAAPLTRGAIGTAAYMAPEQVSSSGTVGPPADQYAAAVMLFEMLSGEMPHEGGMVEVAARKLREAPRDIRALFDDRPDDELPEHVAAAIMRALSLEPAQRHPSVSAMRRALNEQLDPSSASLEAEADQAAALGGATLPPLETGEAPPSGAVHTLAPTEPLGDVAVEDQTPSRAMAEAPPRLSTAQHTPTHTGEDAPRTSRAAWLLAAVAVLLVAGVVAYQLPGEAVPIPTVTPPTSAAPRDEPTPAAGGTFEARSPYVATTYVGGTDEARPDEAIPEEVAGPDIDLATAAAPPSPALAPAPVPVSVDEPPRVQPARPRRARSPGPARDPGPPAPSEPAFARSAEHHVLRAEGYDAWAAGVHLRLTGRRLARCLREHPTAAGVEAAYRVSIDAQGQVVAVDALGVVPAALDGCARSAVRSTDWTPPIGGGTAQVDASFTLR